MKVNNNKMPCRDNLLKLHYRISFSRREILSILPHKHSVVIGIRSLKVVLKTASVSEGWLHSWKLNQQEIIKCRDIHGYTCVCHKTQ